MSLLSLLFITSSLGLLCTGIVYYAFRRFQGSIRKSVGRDRTSFDLEIAELDRAIESALQYTEGMASYDEVLRLQKEVESLSAELKAEKTRLHEVEERLQKMHTEVDWREGKHSELKKGKEQAEHLADEIRAHYEELKAEALRLEDKLEASHTQMSSLAKEVTLTDDQQKAIEEVTKMLNNVSTQMKDLKEIYHQSRDRFVNLQQQYQELEKEFRKIVEKELTGT